VNIDDDGLCQVAGPTQEKLQVALRMIGDLIQTAEVGKTYLGRVARFRYVSRIPERDAEKVVEFGAFVTIRPQRREDRTASPRDGRPEGARAGARVTILPGLDGLLPPATHALPGI
jgi:hypothetical protein